MKSKPATAAERRRMGIVKENGCVACGSIPANAHHLLSGGVRCGHKFTVGLCDICHYRIHNEKRAFYADYDTDDRKLLAKTNRLVAQFENNTVNGK